MSDTDTFERAQAQGLAKLVSLSAEAPPVEVPDRWTRAGLVVIPELEPVRSPRRAWYSRLRSIPWLLLGVLAVQAWLAVRLMWANTAFQDEGLYLWAGRLEWAHWLHGAPIPGFTYWFSGVPFLYPPLAAVVNALGGLVAARMLSLVFMLSATVFLYLAGKRLYGTTAGLIGAALFAVLGPVAQLGSRATYDAMSLGLLACAAWCAAQGSGRSDATAWTLGAGISLVAANLVAYSTAIFDPVVIAMAILAGFPDEGFREARGRGIKVLFYVVSIVAVVAVVGGISFLHGFYHVILNRVPGSSSDAQVLDKTASWGGVAIVAGAFGLLVSLATDRVPGRRLLAVTLAGAAVAVPLEQMNVHTTTSLSKHVILGAWFAALIAGYGAMRLIVMVRPVVLRAFPVLLVVTGLAAAAWQGAPVAQVLATDWPNATAFVTGFSPIVAHTSGRLPVETPSVAEYYLSQGNQWQRWEGTNGITGIGKVAPSYYERLLRKGYFSLVALNFHSTVPLDKALDQVMRRDRHFKVVATLPYGPGDQYTVWRYQGGSR